MESGSQALHDLLDRYPDLARRVGLTTVSRPLAGKGRTAGELLLTMGLSTGSSDAPKRIILPTSVEIRRTSGPPPVAR